MKPIIALSLAALLAGCMTINDHSAAPADETLTAMRGAHVRECPADRRQANAQSAGFGERSGVTSEDVALIPLAHDSTRAVRLRRLIVEPGGIIPWHDHATIQGMAVLVSGEMVEIRSTCLDRLTYRAGDIAIEDAETVHSWRNDGDEPAVILVSHVVAR